MLLHPQFIILDCFRAPHLIIHVLISPFHRDKLNSVQLRRFVRVEPQCLNRLLQYSGTKEETEVAQGDGEALSGALRLHIQ